VRVSIEMRGTHFASRTRPESPQKVSRRKMERAVYMVLRAKHVRTCARIQAKTAMIHYFQSDLTRYCQTIEGQQTKISDR
jgi:hypothetical protein